MKDVELMAKTVILFARSVEAIGENDMRRLIKEAPTYGEGSISFDLQKEIQHELDLRLGVKRNVELSDMIDALHRKTSNQKLQVAGDSCKDESDGVKDCNG